MARREHGGLSYETAEGWQSRDVVVLTRAGSDGEVHNIVMAWEAREPSEQLFQHAFRERLRSAQKCAGGFQTKEFSKTLVAGRAAVRTRYLRRGEGGVPREQVVYGSTARTKRCSRSRARRSAPSTARSPCCSVGRGAVRENLPHEKTRNALAHPELVLLDAPRRFLDAVDHAQHRERPRGHRHRLGPAKPRRDRADTGPRRHVRRPMPHVVGGLRAPGRVTRASNAARAGPIARAEN